MQKDKTEWHKIEQYFKIKAVTVRKAIKTSFYNIAEYKAQGELNQESEVDNKILL